MPSYARIEDLPEQHRPAALAQLEEWEKGRKTEARKQLDRAMRESLSRLFLAHWERNELPTLTPEHKFHPDRRWRLDYALPELKIGIEIHGGTRRQGRHNRAQGFANDREKMNAALGLGWQVYELTDVMLKEGQQAMDGYLQPIRQRLEGE